MEVKSNQKSKNYFHAKKQNLQLKYSEGFDIIDEDSRDTNETEKEMILKQTKYKYTQTQTYQPKAEKPKEAQKKASQKLSPQIQNTVQNTISSELDLNSNRIKDIFRRRPQKKMYRLNTGKESKTLSTIVTFAKTNTMLNEHKKDDNSYIQRRLTYGEELNSISGLKQTKILTSNRNTFYFQKKLDNGCEIKGETSNEQINGYGSFTHKNGNKYHGQFKNNQPNGYGLFHSSKIEYEGEFLNGKFSGIGILKDLITGDIYRGEFLNGKFNGVGHLKYANNDEYIGEFKDGFRNGKGQLSTHNGESYFGLWLNNLRNGKAQSSYMKCTYEGYYKNGKKHGRGVLKTAAGDTLYGNFSEGNIIGDVIINYLNGDFYKGEFVYNEGSKIFKGKMKYNNGDTIIGDFINKNSSVSLSKDANNTNNENIWVIDLGINVPNGEGKFKSANGKVTGEHFYINGKQIY